MMFILQEKYESMLAEKDSEIEMLKDHIEVLLDEQETLNRSHHTEGMTNFIFVVEHRFF